MSLDASTDGVNFDSEIARWDEWELDDDSDTTTPPPTRHVTVDVPSFYWVSTFQYRFRWTSNSVDNNHEGCSVDNAQVQDVVTSTDGSSEVYGYKSGTSMAAPHVTGLAALVWGYRPDLSTAQVKNIIFSTGDSIPALA